MKETVLSAVILLTLSGCAKRLPEDELSLTRSRLEHYLLDQDMSQSEMNIITTYILELANMEKYLLEYRIWNQSDFDRIAKEFHADCEAWEKLAEKQTTQPSPYDGGSFVPTDHNSQMTDFVEHRIVELRNKWRQN